MLSVAGPPQIWHERPPRFFATLRVVLMQLFVHIEVCKKKTQSQCRISNDADEVRSTSG